MLIVTRSDYIDPWPQPKRDGKKSKSRKGKKQKGPDDSKRKKKAAKKKKKRPANQREELLAAANPQKWYQPGEESDPESDQDEGEGGQEVAEEGPNDLANALFPEDSLEEDQRDEAANGLDEDADEQPGNSRKRKSDDLDAADPEEADSDRGADSP